MYKGFTFYFYDLVPQLIAWNESLDISFSIGLSDIQYIIYNKTGIEYKSVLENTMKGLINNYLIYIKENNEYNKSKI